MNKKNRISACLIIKNEEFFLDNCLSSIEGKVDEIVVVDTGSTDNSIEIAKKYTNKVYFRKWDDNFSNARNYSLKKAKNPWVFIIDADEKLDQNTDLYSIIKENRKYNVFTFKEIEKDFDSRKTYSKTRTYERLFHKNTEPKFYGNIHNKLKLKHKNIKHSSGIIYHYGYHLKKTKLEKKYKKRLKMLYKRRENLNDFESNYYIVNMLFLLEKYNEMFEESLKIVNNWDIRKYKLGYKILMYMSHILYKNKNYTDGLKLLKKYNAIVNKKEILKFYYGLFLSFNNKYNKSNDYLKIIKPNEDFTMISNFSRIRYYLLSRNWLMLNNDNELKKYLKKYLQTFENKEKKVLKEAELYLNHQEYNLFEKKIDDLKNFNNHKGFYFIGIYYEKNNKFTEAKKYYKKSLQLKEDSSVLNSLGVLYINNDCVNKGIELLKKAINQEEVDIRAYDNLYKVYKNIVNDFDKAKKIADMKAKLTK